MTNPYDEARFSRPNRRMMVFVDGENLVCRYQKMLEEGYIPRDDIAYDRNTYVWHLSFTYLAQWREILRVTYYTYAVGSDERIASVRSALRQQEFARHMASVLPNKLTACVFKKDRQERSGKGVDVQMSVDILSHVFRGNVDAILLMSGDGDYAPLLDEVRRAGVQVYLSAFSNGLNPMLSERADDQYLLDNTTWKQATSK